MNSPLSETIQAEAPAPPEHRAADLGRPIALQRRGAIPRDRLVSRLVRSAGSDCVLVIAPSGYGKTTLMAEWADADARDFAWVTLDERHDDAGLLIGSIAAALDRISPLDATVLAPLASPQPNVARVVVPRLCDSLDGRSPAAIVLDDAHTVRSESGREVIAAVAQCMPAGMQLVIASREEPEIGIGRLRTQRSVIQLGAEDLAMTRSEASRLFRAGGQPLERDRVAELVERTEGWPAALYLAALWLRDESDSTVALERFTGDDRLVADYLREEFLSRIDEETLGFLVRASVLDRLSGDVCDYVLEREGSAEELRRLSRSNLLLVPLDHRDREYRFHALLREMLQAELHRLGEGGERALHARASDWYANRDDADRAVDHAIASGDERAAGELMWKAMPRYSGSGRQPTLLRWLAEFSDEQMRGSAALGVTAAVVFLVEGDGAQMERWAQSAERALALEGRDDDELSAGIDLLLGLAGERDGVVGTAERFAAARGGLPIDANWRTLSCLTEGALRHLAGDRDGASAVLAEGVRISGPAAPSTHSICLAQLALIALDEGDVEGAWSYAHSAHSALEHYGLDQYPTSAIVFAAGALAAARRGDATMARSRLEVGRELLDRHRDLTPWYEAETRIAMARASILLDDVPRGREQLAAARPYAARIPDAIVLGEWLSEAAAAADAAGADAGRWPLTPAEIRLLHYLPTHHSFPEIAEQLFVSTNTVKTQAKSIYRKFGVSSRAEAVACAQAAGLLSAESPGSEDAGNERRT